MKRYRIGIFGVGRGMDIAKNFMLLNCEIVAVCDFHKDRLAAALAKLDQDTAAYEDFDIATTLFGKVMSSFSPV